MTTTLVPFDFEGQPVRVVTDEHGEPWFVASDIAQSLEYRMASDMTRSLDDDERGTQIVRTLFVVIQIARHVRRIPVIKRSGHVAGDEPRIIVEDDDADFDGL